MELTVLGSSAAWPAPGRAASGYLLRHGGFNLWLDAGTGTLSNLQTHLPHERVDAILLSHEHPDHCLDLYPLYTARRFHWEPLPPMPVYALPGVFDRVASLEDAEGREEMARQFDVHEVEAGSEFQVGPFRVSTRLLPHWVPDLGMRISADGIVLGYTGDTGPDEGVEHVGRDVDLLVAEASWLEGEDHAMRLHLTAREAAEHAGRAGAHRLLLTHLWPGVDRRRSEEEARGAFDGELLVAEEGMTVRVRS